MPTPELKDGGEEEDAESEETDEEVIEDGGSEEEPAEDEETETAEESGEDEEEEVDVDEAELPEGVDEEGGDEDGDSATSGLLSGTTFGISNKFLLGIGVAAIVIVLLLARLDQQTTTKDYTQEDVEDEIDEGSDGAVQESEDVTAAGGSAGRFNEQNQQHAIESVFDN